MLDFKIKTTKIDTRLDLPDKRFWTAVTLDGAKEIRKRTESGESVEGREFKPYSPSYAKKRQKKGRSLEPNLTFTGRMLGSIRSVGRDEGGTISISGREGFKAWANEEQGREWFELSDEQHDSIIKRVTDWMTRRNDLKR